MKRNTWFEETFLPSLEKSMNNPKYPNSCILSEKQSEVCAKYMDECTHTDLYGKSFRTYEYNINSGSCRKHYQLTFNGRYRILHMNELPKEVYVVDYYDFDEHEDYIATFDTIEDRDEWLAKNVVDDLYNGKEIVTFAVNA